MNLAIIITLSVILVFLIFLVFLLLKLYQKNRKLTLANFTNDLNQRYNNFFLQPIAIKDLPMSEEKLPTKSSIYYCNRALVGQYENPRKIINDKNYDVTSSLKNNKNKISYHYKIINFRRAKFIPLNTIELLLTKTKLYIYHPLDPESINLKQIKNLTIFWAQNRLLKTKDFFPGVGFQVNNQSYFLLFQTYQQLLKFLACLNTILD
ncbi:MAG: hypothetical protein REH79_01830 [Spiroplasma sp.]|nr:hypothetical protein [Spiroplasma sp.]